MDRGRGHRRVTALSATVCRTPLGVVRSAEAGTLRQVSAARDELRELADRLPGELLDDGFGRSA